MLRGANIVLGVSGGIAAYKSAYLTRLLVKAGANVSVAMTEAAQEFIGRATFQALSGNPVFTNLWSARQEADIGHITLADKAGLVVVAPATATTIARLATGAACDPVSCVALATTAPLLLAPSMNVNMWNNPVTQRNLSTLRSVCGAQIVEPDVGYLACNWTGKGRMAEPEQILSAIEAALSPNLLAGKKVVITAGPTREMLDPVRFLSNRSTGKMGMALATAASRSGAAVTLILGPTQLQPPPGVEVISVVSARDMGDALDKVVGRADLVFKAAAVADYAPEDFAMQKLKKGELGGEWSLKLRQTTDLLAKLKDSSAFVVGFAAETTDVVANAKSKCARKGCDAIVANDVSRKDAGFESDTNKVVIVRANGDCVDVPFGSKADVATNIIESVAGWLS